MLLWGPVALPRPQAAGNEGNQILLAVDVEQWCLGLEEGISLGMLPASTSPPPKSSVFTLFLSHGFILCL